LVLACEIGYITVVDRLLQDKRVNPSFNYNSALFEACQHGHIAIVDLLLQDKRVDPNSIYRFKKNNNQTKIINRLQQEIKNRGKVKQ
jgi:ankyrin repeat protein